MKIYRYCLIILSTLILFACEKETEGISTTTIYCDLELKGKSVELVPLNGSYVEPGWVADENGTDVSDKVTVAGSVNASVAGLYTLTYSVKNVDGFPKTTTRRVIVADNTPSLLESGVYIVSKNSNRNGTVVWGKEFPILIYQVSPGKFYVSDFLGGYYDQRAGYGSMYAMTGHITVVGVTFVMNDSQVAGWGDSLDSLSNCVYNPATKTISWTAAYIGTYNFNVIATKE